MIAGEMVDCLANYFGFNDEGEPTRYFGYHILGEPAHAPVHSTDISSPSRRN